MHEARIWPSGHRKAGGVLVLSNAVMGGDERFIASTNAIGRKGDHSALVDAALLERKHRYDRGQLGLGQPGQQAGLVRLADEQVALVVEPGQAHPSFGKRPTVGVATFGQHTVNGGKRRFER